MAKKCTVLLQDEVNCAILGLSEDHIAFFYNKYGLKAPNYFFNPKYQLGSWDGNIRYFHKTGKTFVNLLPEILPLLLRLGYKVNLDDQRRSDKPQPDPITKDFFGHILDPETGEPIEFRPYQVEAVNLILSNGGGIIVAGTGAGKTMMCAGLSQSYVNKNQRVILIVPSTDLIEQTYLEFVDWGLDVGQYGGTDKDLDHDIVVSTWQALQHNKTIIRDFNVVIVDECHGIKGNVLTDILNEHGNNISTRIGVTGTLPDNAADQMAVRIAVGEVQFEITAAELIAQGWLAKLDIDIIQLEENFEKEYKQFKNDYPNEKLTYRQFVDEYFPEWTQEKTYLQNNKLRMQHICGIIEGKRNQNKGNVFCLVDGVQFGKKLTKMIPGAKFVHGKDKKKARREVYDLFKEHDNLVVIATVQVAGTGLNIKRIFNLMFIDVGKSFIRIVQTIGRGLRKAPDKDSVNVTDVCSDLKYSRRHLTARKKIYKEAHYPNTIQKVKYQQISLLD